MTENENKIDEEIDTLKQQEGAMEKKLSSFEARWKFLVFPAMIAFIILAGFGFYLIYGMLQRMEQLSQDVHRMANVVEDTMPTMQGGVVSMSSRMQWIGEDLDRMTSVVANTMPSMEQQVGEMSTNIGNITYATSSMANSTHSMGQNIWNMNRNVSKPLSLMRRMMPFGESGGTPPAPNMTPYSYNSGVYSPNYSQPAIKPTVAAVPVSQVTEVTSTAGEVPELTTEASTASTQTPETNEQSKAEEQFASAYRVGSERFEGVCSSCHGVRAEGGFGPRISGLNAEQIEMILNQYRNGERTGTMSGLIKTLSLEDQKNISIFLEHYTAQYQ